MMEYWTIRYDEEGRIDEILAERCAVHLERMDDGHVWIEVVVDEISLHVDLTTRRAHIAIAAEER